MKYLFFSFVVITSTAALAQTEVVDQRKALLRDQFRAAGPLGEANRKELKSGEAWACVSPLETIQLIRSNANLSGWLERTRKNPDLKFDVSCLQNQLRASAKDLDLSESGFINGDELALRRRGVSQHIYLRVTPEGLIIGEFTRPVRPDSTMRSIVNSNEEVFNYFLCVPEDQLSAPLIKVPPQDSDTSDKECAPIS